MTGRFTGKVALVSAGGAGIGKATAERFARDGARLMVCDRDAETAEATADELRRTGVDARALQADSTQEQDVERVVRKTIEAFGALDFAANVVGDAVLDSHGPDLHLQSLEGWDGTIAVSLRSVFLSLKHQIAYMIEHGGGSIVNVTSLAGMLYVPEGGPAYAASKAGVIQLTKFAALTYADRGVRVNCIAPGTTVTAAYYKQGEEAAKVLISRMLEGHAIKRGITPDEQAGAIAWLCSDEAAMITGQNLAVDAGWSAR